MIGLECGTFESVQVSTTSQGFDCAIMYTITDHFCCSVHRMIRPTRILIFFKIAVQRRTNHETIQTTKRLTQAVRSEFILKKHGKLLRELAPLVFELLLSYWCFHVFMQNTSQ